jgi:hypothetical protein
LPNRRPAFLTHSASDTGPAIRDAQHCCGAGSGGSRDPTQETHQDRASRRAAAPACAGPWAAARANSLAGSRRCSKPPAVGAWSSCIWTAGLGRRPTVTPSLEAGGRSRATPGARQGLALPVVASSYSLSNRRRANLSLGLTMRAYPLGVGSTMAKGACITTAPDVIVCSAAWSAN